MFSIWVYVFPLGLWFSIRLMVSFCIDGFPLGLCVCFGIMIFLCSCGFGYKVIWDERGVVCFVQRATKELWQDNWFLSITTTTTTATTSVTTLVSIRNTRVFQMALTALTEPRTLWRRITCYPSPRWWVTLHSISKMYFSHWKPPGVSERVWSVNLDASMSGVSDPRRAFLPAFRVTGSANDKPGSTWKRRRHVWEHLESQSCIQSVFSSIYLCTYTATHLHMVYLDWLQAVLESNSRGPRKWWSSELRDILWGRDRASLEFHLEAVIKRIWWYSWRPRLSEHGDALWDRDRASLEVHLEAMLMRTCMPESSELGVTLGGRDRVSLEIQLESVIEQDWTSTWRRSMDGAPGDETLFIS